MKAHTKIILSIVNCLFLLVGGLSYAQDSTIVRVKNTFGGNLIIDNQTVMVPAKKTFEFALQHRFGTINNGYSDLYGLFSGANVRFGFSYTPTSNLQLGAGLCEEKMQWDGNIKYAIGKQAVSNGCPISVTYYGDMAASTLPMKGNFVSNADRLSYFNQLLIARKINKVLSVQVAPSLSYFNNVEGYRAADGSIQTKLKNAHFAIAFMARYMIAEDIGIIANYDQPITQHYSNNPHPNVSFGFEFGTMGHTFQIFAGNFQSILPQSNNMFNQNDFTKSQYCIGFNLTRRWYDFLSN